MILISSTQRRGAEVFGEHLADALKEAGRVVSLLALHQSDAGATVGAAPLFGSAEIADVSGLKPIVVRRLRSAIRDAEPDVVLAGGGATLKYSVAALIGLRDSPALVYSSIGEPEYWASNWWRKQMMSALLARTRLITAVSQATADQLVRSFKVSPKKVRVVHPGVPDEFVTLEHEEGAGDRLNILYLGSMSNEKNPLSAVSAVGMMESPANLRMVGAGPLLGDLEESAGTAGFPIEVWGPSEDVRDHLRWADALILTSKTEGLPGVILEASAAGVPVVAYGVGGVPEAIEDGVTGFVTVPGDEAEMGRALDRLARSPKLRSSMAEAGKRRVKSHFLLSHALDRYVAALDGTIRT